MPGLQDTLADGSLITLPVSVETAGEGGPADLISFLGEDRSALRFWLGDRLAAGLRDEPDPVRRRARLRGLIDRDLVRIDAMLGRQIDAILHHPRLQRLEGSWRALARLVGQAEGESVRIKLFTAQWAELARDLDRAIEFDQSAFFRLVYENEFGMAGGEPFGLLVVDHEVSHRPLPRSVTGAAPVDDVTVLKHLRAVAAAAFVPTVLGASPTLLGADQFSDLALSRDPTSVLADVDHARWRSMTDAEDSRFLALTMPRILARTPWSSEQTGGMYEEYAPDEARRCWSLGGYALAANVLRAHLDHRWPADIRGVIPGRVGGGLVTGLPEDPFRFGAETTLPRGVTDLAFSDGQERALIEAGIMPLNTLPYGHAAFGAVRSLQRRHAPPPGQKADAAQATRRISSEINALLCASRFAHYLKIIGRDMIGGHASAPEIERTLATWLRSYTNSNVAPGAGSRARYPLLSSQVQVSEIPGRPGAYGCIIHLQPFHQLNDVSTTLRLTTNLSSGATGAAGAAITAASTRSDSPVTLSRTGR